MPKGLTPLSRIGFAASLCLLTAAPLPAGDILPQIAGEAPLVLIVRDPRRFTERTNQLLARIKPGTPPKTVQSLINTSIRLPPNAIDESAPIAVMYSAGGMSANRPVLIFKPATEERWLVAADPDQPIAVARLGTTCYGRRGEWVFASESQRPILRALRASGKRSLASALDERERALFDQSDTLVRMRMGAWQTEIGQALGFLRMFGNVGAIGSDDLQSQAQSAAVGWFLDGVAKVATDMSVLDLGLTIDDAGIRFVHYHAFKPDSNAAKYLRGVHHNGGDIWRGLEARPFLAAFAWDAKSEQDSSVMQDLMQRIMKISSLSGASTQPAMTQLLHDCENFYHREQAAATLVDFSPRGTLGIYGVKKFEDPAEGVRLLQRISEQGSQVMDAFAPSWASGGEFKQVDRGGLDVLEMSFASCKDTNKSRALIEAIYGKDAVYQLAALGKDSLGYAISNDSGAIELLARSVAGKAPSLGAMPAVARISKHLPDKPCMVAVVDVERATRFLPAFSQADQAVSVGSNRIEIHAGGPSLDRPLPRIRSSDDMPKGPGPLIGWAMTTGPNWVRGEAYMSQDDAVNSVPLLKRMSQEFKAAEERSASQTRRTKIRVIEQKGD